MSPSGPLPKAFARAAMMFLAVAQVFLALAPLAEVRGSSSIPHVEQAGTSEHHSHDEGTCTACVARTLLNSSELSGGAAFRLAHAEDVHRAGAVNAPADRRSTGPGARAPPLNRA